MIEAKIRESSRQILLPSPSKVTFNGGFSGKKLDSSKRSLSIFKNPYSLFYIKLLLPCRLVPKSPAGTFLLITTGEGIQIKMIFKAKKINSKKLNSHWPSHSSVSKILGDLGELSYFE